MNTARLIYIIGVIFFCISAGNTYAQTGGDAIIYPETKGKLIDAFFYDLKQSPGAVSDDSKANDLFVVDGMNGIRIPIYGNVSKPAHPSTGVVVNSEYQSLIESINRAKAIRGNAELKIFASKKLDGQSSFPDWVKDANGVISVQYAKLLSDYIKYMNTKGVEIDVLGIDNEREYNEGNITPQKHKEIVDILKTLAVSEKFKMPLIIAPDGYGPNKDNWIKTMSQNGWLDRMDLYGTHYYPQYRPKNALISDLNYAVKKPFWSTEPHWDNKSGQDQLAVAEEAICALWDQIDLGMSGVMWWNYELTTLRGYLMRNITVPLLGAQPINIDDKDGRDISSLGKLQTRAFRKGDLITVYAVNLNTTVSYLKYGFQLFSGYIKGSVNFKQWTDGSAITGITGIATKSSEAKFECTLPARSITSFTFELNTFTGIKDISNQNSISLFPNPVSEILNIKGLKNGVSYTVSNMNGEKLLEGNSPKIDVSTLMPGLYILKISDDVELRFIKKQI